MAMKFPWPRLEGEGPSTSAKSGGLAGGPWEVGRTRQKAPEDFASQTGEDWIFFGKKNPVISKISELSVWKARQELEGIHRIGC